MKKIYFSFVIILLLFLMPMTSVRAAKTTSPGETAGVVAPLEEAPDRSGLYILIGLVAVVSVSLGAGLSFVVTRKLDQKKFTDDFAWEHHEELRETIVEREAEKRIKQSVEESERRKKAQQKKKPLIKGKKAPAVKEDEIYSSPFIDDIDLRDPEQTQPAPPPIPPIPIIATPVTPPKQVPPLPPRKPNFTYDTDGCMVFPDGTKKLLDGSALPAPEYDENGEVVLWAGRALYYDGEEPFYVENGVKHFYYKSDD